MIGGATDTGEFVESGDPDEPPKEYWQRRAEIAAVAAGLDAPPRDVEYHADEHATWAAVCRALTPRWEQHAVAEVLDARGHLDLPTDHIPQLATVDAQLRPLTGFGYRAVDGIVPGRTFFRALSAMTFPSTQYVRWSGAPFYTPEPDVIHEVMGHGNCLAVPELAELHRLAGQAVGRVDGDRAFQVLADVFWFTAEFGVMCERGSWKAYGAGLLSSPGEVDWFADHADIRPLDVVDMATVGYDIHRYQPVLFGAESMAQLLDVVGGFYADATDATIAELLTAPHPPRQPSTS